MIDTIVACSTAPGPGAISVVRLSGPTAVEVARRICPALPERLEARHARLVKIVHPVSGHLLDQALATSFTGPQSYTGEDMVELSCHGGWLSPALVVEAALGAGARLAEPGEFTRRAYLNGKMDLVQAEAVLDLVEGRSRALRRVALGQLERGLSERVSGLRLEIVHLEALLAHHIDFPEEDEAPVAVGRVADKADLVASGLDALVRTFPEGQLLRDGAVTVLAGLPNVGKSSLFNALLGQDRAIVTDVPGTTRDAVEAVVGLGGYPFRLVDTAGIRSTEESVERIGVEVARRYVAQADLILFCVEAGSAGGAEEREFVEGLPDVPLVVVRTKVDRGGGSTHARLGRAAVAEVAVSAQTGEGFEELQRLLPELVFGGLVSVAPDVPVVTRKRQADGLRCALAGVRSFAEALRDRVPAEVAATHLRPAETALEELLGVISIDEVLDKLFRDFCIGK